MIMGMRAMVQIPKVMKRRLSREVQIRRWAGRGSHGLTGTMRMGAAMRMTTDQDKDGGAILQVQSQNHPPDHKNAVCSQ